ncbi:MAG: iron-containing alcohol dehydrogenase family protein [Saccharofermentanales bacterium]
MKWHYQQPVEIYFGNDERFRLGEIAEKLGVTKAVLVCDRILATNGTVQDLIDRTGNLIAAVYDKGKPNPTVKNVDECAELIRSAKADFVVAIGGGSSMDCAKAAAVVAPLAESITVYHGTGVSLPAGGLPIIQIPSTAGTGSEVTAVSVLTNEEKGFKAPLASPSFYATAAIVDPVITWSMPPHITAITGLDVLSHAVEGYQSRNNQPITDLFCLEAARLVFRHLRAACASPASIEAREQMAQASLLAGLGFNLPKTGPSHACSFVLTNRYGIPHGEACALTLDSFLEIIAQGDGGRMNEFATACGFVDAAAMAEEIRALKRDLGVRLDLKDLNLDEAALQDLIRDSHHPNMLNSPVEITDEMLREMYESML